MHPERIGEFRIVRVLGEGAMGTVYEAEQDNPRRRVALKVVRAGIVRPDLVQRFEREAQVLGLLQHPGIAHVYHAGTADCGQGMQPYFAMELVIGRSLTDHARDANLTMRQKLELLARVCDAVQHAHAKGIVHRDLKPGNILVVAEDAPSHVSHSGSSARSASLDDVAFVGQPKILDFGLARVTDPDLQMATLQTEVGQILGTVQFMSPEQASGDSARIGVKSDIYALGVIGYVLLSGRPPYEVQGRMMLEAYRTIREDEPTPLSSVDRSLRGDVETIVGKAIEKDPARRYPSAADMAADLRHFLRNEPIEARPPSTGYQIKKFAARNKALVAGVCATFAALLVGIVATAWQAFEATRARDAATRALDTATLARDAEREAKEEATHARDAATEALDAATRARDSERVAREEATIARDDARASADEATAINDFLIEDLLGASNPEIAKGRDLTLSEVLENASNKIDERLANQPELATKIRATLALVEYRLGHFDVAERHYRAALTELLDRFGPENKDVLNLKQDLARVLAAQDRMGESEALLRETLEVRIRSGDKEKTISNYTSLAQTLYLAHDTDGAEAAYHEALALLEEIDEPSVGTRTSLATVLSDLAGILAYRGKHAEARSNLDRAASVLRSVHGDVHPDLLRVRGRRAELSIDEGRPADAIGELRAVLEAQRELFKRDHPDLANSLRLLGSAAYSSGDYALAEQSYREQVDVLTRLYGGSSGAVASARTQLAKTLAALGRSAEAVQEFERALSEYASAKSRDENDVANTYFELAVALRGRGDLQSAEKAADEALRIRRSLGKRGADLVQSMSLSAQILHSKKDYERAEPLYLEVLRLYVELRGPDHVDVAVAHANLGMLHLDRGANAEAEADLRSAVDTAERILAPDHPSLAAIRVLLARALRRTDKSYEALALLEQALETQRARLPAGNPSTASTSLELGELYTEAGRAAEAEPLLRDALASRRATSAGNAPRIARATGALGASLAAQKKYDEAEPLLLESHRAWKHAGDDAAEMARAAERLRALYTEWKRADEAERWAAEARGEHSDR